MKALLLVLLGCQLVAGLRFPQRAAAGESECQLTAPRNVYQDGSLVLEHAVDADSLYLQLTYRGSGLARCGFVG